MLSIKRYLVNCIKSISYSPQRVTLLHTNTFSKKILWLHQNPKSHISIRFTL